MAVDLTQIDEIIKKRGTSATYTIPILQDVQETLRYVPLEVIEHIAKKTEMNEADLYGVATFYTQFRLEPVGEKIVKVCHGTACHVGGAEGLTESLEERLGIKNGENTPDMKYTLDAVACVGCCSLAPVVMVEAKTYGKLDRKKAAKIIDDLEG